MPGVTATVVLLCYTTHTYITVYVRYVYRHKHLHHAFRVKLSFAFLSKVFHTLCLRLILSSALFLAAASPSSPSASASASPARSLCRFLIFRYTLVGRVLMRGEHETHRARERSRASQRSNRQEKQKNTLKVVGHRSNCTSGVDRLLHTAIESDTNIRFTAMGTATGVIV